MGSEDPHATPSEPAHGEASAAPLKSGAIGVQGFNVAAFPVFDLRRGTATTFFCSPVKAAKVGTTFGHLLLQQLSEEVRADIDLELAGLAVGYANRFAKAKLVAAIGTTVSMSTLARIEARRAYFAVLGARPDASTTPFLVSIELIPAGTPMAKISEFIGYLKRVVRYVFVVVPEVNDRGWYSGKLGATGFGIWARPQDKRDDIARQARALNSLCALQGAVSFIDGLVLPEALEGATISDVRFGTGPALRQQPFPLDGELPKVPLPFDR